jgi:hypothetical protein
LVLAGAFFGGVFPGALFAFVIAAALGVSGSEGEAVCLVLNLVFGAAGALMALWVAAAMTDSTPRHFPILASLLLGLLAGLGGYCWALWEINHADPPL